MTQSASSNNLTKMSKALVKVWDGTSWFSELSGTAKLKNSWIGLILQTVRSQPSKNCQRLLSSVSTLPQLRDGSRNWVRSQLVTGSWKKIWRNLFLRISITSTWTAMHDWTNFWTPWSRKSKMRMAMLSLGEEMVKGLTRIVDWRELNCQVDRSNVLPLLELWSKTPRFLFLTKLLQLSMSKVKKLSNKLLTEPWKEELQLLSPTGWAQSETASFYSSSTKARSSNKELTMISLPILSLTSTNWSLEWKCEIKSVFLHMMHTSYHLLT